MGMRILLLLTITWIMRLTRPLFSAFGRDISGRDLILICGGLFLMYKATVEIHDKLEGQEGHSSARVVARRKELDRVIWVRDFYEHGNLVCPSRKHGLRFRSEYSRIVSDDQR